jgi:SAM-dependent methyltransferase
MPQNDKESVTRGFGLLERYLAKKRSRRANALISAFHRNGRILDIGCGTYPYFLVETEFKEKYGIDKSGEMTRHKDLAGYDSLHLQQWDFGKKSALPFENDYFDVVTMLAVFEHIEVTHIRQLVSEIFRILKKDGLFILTTPAGWTDRLLRLMARLKLVYTHEKIIHILTDSGFFKKNIRLGYFEMFMNIWAATRKGTG